MIEHCDSRPDRHFFQLIGSFVTIQIYLLLILLLSFDDLEPAKSDRKIDGFLAHFWSRNFGTELCVKW